MKKIALTLLAASAMTACTITPSGQESANSHDVAFSCMNGETVRVRFDNAKEMAVLERNGEKIELAQQRSGSGFIYSNGSNTIRGKGDQLSVEIGRMVPIACTAAQ